MCGIFGALVKDSSELSEKYDCILQRLFLLSESRGKEASGFASIKDVTIYYHKTPFTASDLVKSKEYKDYFRNYLIEQDDYLVTIGHSRLVTNGYEHFNKNNQPVIKNGVCVVHNGIIVNQDSIWRSLDYKTKESELDTELIPTLISGYLKEDSNFNTVLTKFYEKIYGMTSTAMLFEDYDNIVLATNNGSLYYVFDDKNSVFLFASENYILRKLIEEENLTGSLNPTNIKQLLPRNSLIVNLNNLDNELVDFLNNVREVTLRPSKELRKFNEIESKSVREIYTNTSFEYDKTDVPKEFVENYERRKKEISELKRCKKCILPETFPYIEFDEVGVCNYCNNYKKIDYKGHDELVKLVNQFKRNDGKHDCLMPFSGGRDSSYALHYVVKELGMNPLAYSYDWGMITDLARRNQARMCDKLGVEHILISADIRKKRSNIHKNVSAWLKRPNLGTIPLFMAGDKQYFYYANLLMQQNDLKLSILGENLLETTNFKSGFCGIRPNFAKGHTYSLSSADKIKMLLFYGKEYLLNPAYLNSSILDTLDAFKSYYVIEHKNINLYSYVRWDEDIITETLLDEYDWETDPGTRTTWRIGDGTAAFYNYIYYMVAGFNENDTFRSNQIREGDLGRNEAIRKSLEENKPRWDSIKWYCNTIQIDFYSAISKINSLGKL